MGIEALGAGAADLLGSLFFPAADAAATGAADLGVGVGADLLGTGAADLGATLGDAAGAAATGGLGTADLGAAIGEGVGAGAGVAPDLSGLGAAAAGGLTDLTAAADTGALTSTLGDTVGTSASDTLANAVPTAANTDATAAAASGALPSGATSTPAAVMPASQELATGSPDIAAQLGTDPNAAEATAAAGTGSTAAGASAPSSAITPAATTALNNSGSSLSSTLSSVLNNPALKLGELALPAGMLAYNLIKGPAPIPPQANQAITNAGNFAPGAVAQAEQNVPLFNATAANDLNLANNFQISPAQAASLNQWKQDQYNQLIQQIANQGNTNPMSSSEWIQGKNQIDQQALAQQTQMINQLISTAFQASSAANAGVSTAGNIEQQYNSLLMSAAQLQVQQDQNFQNAVGAALQSFGLIAGLQSGNLLKPANTNTPTQAAA